MKQGVKFWLSEFKIDNEDYRSQVRLMNRTTKSSQKTLWINDASFLTARVIHYFINLITNQTTKS